MIIDFRNPDIYVDYYKELTDALYNPDVRYIFLKGGSGSGKSYLVTQIMLQNIGAGVRVGVFRKTSASLRASCLQSFKDVRDAFNINKYVNIKESKEVEFGDGLCMMFGLDDAEKIKSIANFDWFRVEEGTELSYDDFTQLSLRLRGGNNHKIIFTFNPISSKHRLKTEIEDKPNNRKNAVWINKTARDNKFIDKEYLQSLEKLKVVNPKKYEIYAKNKRGEGSEGNVYQEYEVFTNQIDIPDVYGLDFGYNDPTALTALKVEDKEGEDKKRMYVEELLHESFLTSPNIIKRFEELGIHKNILIIADNARPELIADIRRAGYMIEGVKKYAGSVVDQINTILEYKLYIKGHNLLKEIVGYTRKIERRTGETLDVPNDGDDHCCFIGETLVLTNGGWKRIDEITTSDKIYTDDGLRDCVMCGMTGMKKVYQYTIVSSVGVIKITCTPDHLFYTNNGWIEISQLEEGMTVYTTKYSMEGLIDYTSDKDIIQCEHARFTEMCESYITEKSRKVMTYTTLIEIAQTIISKILSLWKDLFTGVCTGKKELEKTLSGSLSFKKRVSQKLQNGIDLTNEENDISNITKTGNTNCIRNESTRVSVVEKNINELSQKRINIVQTSVNQKQGETLELMTSMSPVPAETHSEQISMIKANIVAVDVITITKTNKSIQPTYDITVDDRHNFFANGVLVHNCDSLRYGGTHYKKNDSVALFF